MRRALWVWAISAVLVLTATWAGQGKKDASMPLDVAWRNVQVIVERACEELLVGKESRAARQSMESLAAAFRAYSQYDAGIRGK